MEVIKVLLNAVVSELKWMTADVVDSCLNTLLGWPEYMKISCIFLSPDIMQEFSLQPFVDNGSVLFEVTKGLYGLLQGCPTAPHSTPCQRRVHQEPRGSMSFPTPC